MSGLTSFLQTFGNLSVEYFWFPLIVWTVIAIPVTLFLRQSDSIPPVYQYHSRVALLFALPLGIIGSYVTGLIGQTAETVIASTKLIVVQNPITATASTEGASQVVSYSNPLIWIGILGTVVISGALLYLIRIMTNAYSLKQLANELNFIPISQIKDLNITNPSNHIFKRIFVAFSDDVNIPFTYGWFTTRIVIPADLKHDPQKCSMAVHHELMHIKHRDFVLNGILMLIKALFWFHPLTHYLHNTGREYREITCDSEVLAENKFSKKSYASLLVQLAEKDYRNSQLAMSMAVNPSSLKKRIQNMSEHTPDNTKFRSSFLITLVSAATVVLTISCTDVTDITEDGITKNEVVQTQSQIARTPYAPEDSKPLYIVNDEEWDNESVEKLARLKTKYIESIDVLKGKKARNEYGEKGDNGVIKINVHNRDKAFSDLKEVPEPPPSPSNPSKSDDGGFFVAVEEMPKLKGGLGDLQKEINYPDEAREAGAEGRILIQFIINEEGQVEDPSVIKGANDALNEEALRVVKMAEFEPGSQDGEPVPVQYSLPITFQLGSDE